ncbi:MAG: magnesium transporter MgtE N-terminal domain-containing protein [Clostridium fessum]
MIRDDLDNYHANDIAEVLETLDTATRKRLYNISLEMTAEISTYLDEPALDYLHELGLDRAAAVLAEMDADEAVDILENLDPEEKEALIARMDQESKDDIHLDLFLR